MGPSNTLNSKQDIVETRVEPEKTSFLKAVWLTVWDLRISRLWTKDHKPYYSSNAIDRNFFKGNIKHDFAVLVVLVVFDVLLLIAAMNTTYGAVEWASLLFVPLTLGVFIKLIGTLIFNLRNKGQSSLNSKF